MLRLFTKNATRIPPDGALFAGDVNALQDAVAALYDLTQNLGIASISIGESGLQVVRYASGEARLSGSLRTDGIIRALGGLYAGAFTTTQRNAISSPPYGLAILNTTTNRYEWNQGTSGSPSWQPLGGSGSQSGNLGAIPAANSVVAGTVYYAVDQDVEYRSDGSAWTRAPGTPKAGDIVITLNAVAEAGRILCQGQAWPSTTGIYADLFAKWGGSTLPDLRGRMPVFLGTHTDVSGLGNHEGIAVGNRRPKHQHTPHSHLYGREVVSLQGGATQYSIIGNAGTVDHATTAADGGSGGANDPVDSPAYYVVQGEAHL